jgi:hypothetical protein
MHAEQAAAAAAGMTVQQWCAPGMQCSAASGTPKVPAVDSDEE